MKILKIDGASLDKNQLEKHLQKIASAHNLTNKSEKSTYPIPHLIENYNVIQKVYNLLNEHLKLGIGIHPAGEWLLDNLYVIEECVKQIESELTLKKYENFVGIANGKYKGFARIYVLASEIVAYTDNNINKKDLEDYLSSYQTKKNLSMEEIWNIGLFLEIAIIENIREVCEKIYVSQIEKYKAENIAERLIENKEKNEQKFGLNINKKFEKIVANDMQYSFVEYMSYILKRYGKKGYSYLKALEEIVELKGTTISEVIKKEHFDIAVRKVSIGNSITSIKKIQRINFLEIFEKINGVEELLKKDPLGIYSDMDTKTKEYYRNKIKEISKKTKISEVYIARKVLEISKENNKHIGYYLIDDGIDELYKKLNCKIKRKLSPNIKSKIYVCLVIILSLIISYTISKILNKNINKIWFLVLSTGLFLIPSSEIITQIISYVSSKFIKPKFIPKMNFSVGINEENKTIVIIPTIVKNKEKVKELMEKLEVFYLANKSKNLYFCLLGDCTQSNNQEEKEDIELIEEGIKQTEKLNLKYKNDEDIIPIFNFMYRKRTWNEKEKSYMGWERKRGMINEFNEYILGNIENPFRENTIEHDKNSSKIKEKLKSIKYVITLDSDTDLILNSAFELVGAMSHILNKPVLNKAHTKVISGYGIMQPRIGVNLNISYYNLFTKIFAGSGGIDNYTNAISDFYQDNFQEGIFTGKGIYDLKIFSEVLKNKFPENMILSHDLLEGCYLRCGLVSDIMLMDGYPSKYNSFMNRLSRWIRGDWQIVKWLSPKYGLNLISRYKIFDNLRRSLLEIFTIICMTFLAIANKKYLWILYIPIISQILELLNLIIFRNEKEKKFKSFSPKISGIKGIFLRSILTIGCLPYKAYISLKSILKTIYRLNISHKHLLEWMTSEEAENQAKTDVCSYQKLMFINSILGLIQIIYTIYVKKYYSIILGLLWIVMPFIMCYISKPKVKTKAIEKLDKNEKEYIKEIGKKTWNYFETYLTKENNYLIPDNYQNDRKEKIVYRTSSTNIGLSLMAVISACDMNYITKEKAFELLKNIIYSIWNLPKWNGHLYNWYQIKTQEPLVPRYISTVDSGNFVGYMYVVKSYLIEMKDIAKDNSKDELLNLIKIVDEIIDNTDFSQLYNNELQIFSIGFNIEENKLTDSYYDLLASESRQASLVAIAKKDVPVKHWKHLSRTLTTLEKYKGLISWSGTAFEYLMPDINIPRYKGSLLDESCKFMIFSQKEYSKKLNIPYGISEAAFNVKDLKSNYQYKAFGIPWLGLKRGLADELVVSSYGGILMINDIPKDEIKNLKRLESEGMYGKFGFYESIDYTPERVEKDRKYSVVKTYMAHHQGLILLSINNLFNNKILQKRFMQNPEMKAISILLQETMPETSIITKEKKEKVEKLKYKDYENYIVKEYKKIDERLITGNVISNENYTIAINQKGEGVSKYKDIYVNRYKVTDDYSQGIFFMMKNVKTKQIWSSNYIFNDKKDNNYLIKFMPDKIEQELHEGNIKTKIETTIASNEPVELRRAVFENQGKEEELIEVTTYFEPVLSKKEQDYAHPAFNNLFLSIDIDKTNNSVIVKRNARNKNEKNMYLAANLSTDCEIIGDLEYEFNGNRFIGRGNLGIPVMVKDSIPLSKKVGLVTEPIIALKRTIKIKPQEKVNVDFIISVGENKEIVNKNLQKYLSKENVKNEFDLSKARVEAESRYLGIKGKEIELYQKMLSYMIFDNSVKSIRFKNANIKKYKQSDLWKYGISGDFPIILIKIKDVNDIYVLKDLLKAYEFFRSKNFKTELVIINEEKYSYENFVKEEIENAILNQHIVYLKNIRTGIFILNKEEVEKQDIELLDVISAINIDSHKGSLKNNIQELEYEYLENYKLIEKNKNTNFDEDNDTDIDILSDKENLIYYNEYGGFSKDGKEYLIKVNKENRLPTVWSNVIANKKFGTILTENMGGYTWYKNSRLNRITSWENNPSYDIPSEIIYLKNTDNNKVWSLGLNPLPDERNYNIIYGFGYCKYIHKSQGIEQENEIFVPTEDSCKINILRLKNVTPNHKRLKIYYYVKPVIGEDEIKSNGYIFINKANNIIYAENKYSENKTISYISSSEKIISYTGDKKSFMGQENLGSPNGVYSEKLNNENGFEMQNCMAIEIEVNLESYATKEITLILGADESLINCKNTAYKYSKLSNSKQELEKVKRYWKNLLRKIASLYSYRIK